MDCDREILERNSGFDVLEFGVALMAARPHLKARARSLTIDADEADRLVERALKLAWLERRSFRADDEVEIWLAGKLDARIPH